MTRLSKKNQRLPKRSGGDHRSIGKLSLPSTNARRRKGFFVSNWKLLLIYKWARGTTRRSSLNQKAINKITGQYITELDYEASAVRDEENGKNQGAGTNSSIPRSINAQFKRRISEVAKKL